MHVITHRSVSRHRALAFVLITLAATGACRQVVMPAAGPTRAEMAELWIEPSPNRDLFVGVGGRSLSPRPDALFKVTEVKTSGFSEGYTVVDPQGREWSVKFPPEATTEVVASRLLWGLGYHQPPIYLLSKWRADGAKEPNPQRPARFREKKPAFHGLTDGDNWSYFENPFVGTPQMNGLLVLQVMLGNSDLKDEQNVLYTLNRAVEGARRWYVARDLGHTFGRTGVMNAPRGDIEVFEETPFIKGVNNGRVEFDYRGRHDALFDRISIADVRWICQRLSRLTDRQWQDAFRAGGYDAALAQRFIRRMKQKIAEGNALSTAEPQS